MRKKTKAATMVQKVWRGKMGRRKMQQEISLNAELMFWAASKLQAVFRSKVARRRAHDRLLAATTYLVVVRLSATHTVPVQ